MDLIYAELSSKGPVRPKNEDRVGFWQPDDAEEQRTRGAVVVLADGVGGQGQGDVASRLAVETALGHFQEAKPGTSPPRKPSGRCSPPPTWPSTTRAWSAAPRAAWPRR